MRRFPLYWTLLPLVAACPHLASAQAMVENALGAGRAATSAAPMKGIGGALNNLEKTLNKNLNGPAVSAPPRTSTTPVNSLEGAKLATLTVAPPAVHYDDPNLIKTGVAYGDLVRQFGPATLEITTGPITKTLSYVSRGAVFQVDLIEGKVSQIEDVTHGTIVGN